VEKKDPVTPDTIFGTASVTKSFTALAIMKLVAEGRLSVQDSVITYLPEWKLPTVHDMRKITIAQLLSHTTGLPPIRRREELTRFQEHITYLNTETVSMLGEPGEYFSYCNDTFLLLGAIIERVTRKGFREYLTDNILVPLGMKRTTLNLEELATMDPVAVPYEFNKSTGTYEKRDWPTLGNYVVGGGIRSTVGDLLKYGEQFISEYPIVSKDQLQSMWQPYVRVHEDTFYGYALTTTPYVSGLTLVEHGGGQPGVSSYFGFVPEEELVVAVLINVSGAPSSDIWLAGVNAALDLPIKQPRREVKVFTGGRYDNRLAGDYHSAENGTVSISIENESATICFDGESYSLLQTGEDTFLVEELNIPLRFFYQKENKRSWAMLFGFRMLRSLGEEEESIVL
jgi:CubicO group peptidase (beta-lactamase class C family)